MFASLLRTNSGRRSERTPLLAALNRYRNGNDEQHSRSEDDEYDEIAQYEGEDDDDDNNTGAIRQDHLLPVFGEFLGTDQHFNVCLLGSQHIQIGFPRIPLLTSSES